MLFGILWIQLNSIKVKIKVKKNKTFFPPLSLCLTALLLISVNILKQMNLEFSLA